MDAASKASAILDDLRLRQDVSLDIAALRERQNTIRVCADLLPANNTKFLLGHIDAGSELVYEREDTVDDELSRKIEKHLSLDPVERLKRQKERERKRK